jgi:hypothetical protein
MIKLTSFQIGVSRETGLDPWAKSPPDLLI